MLIISNPASGHKKGPKIIDQFVIPLLNKYNVDFTLKTSNAPGHAGELAKEHLATLSSAEKTVILVSGGDGTIHEIVNAVYADSVLAGSKASIGPELQLVLLNTGTANALFHSIYSLVSSPDVQKFVRETIPSADLETINQLQSVAAYLQGTNNMRPLALAHNTTLKQNGTVNQSLLSVVVASTALHANLLHTSEELRESIPGVERFTEAAKRNLDKWSHARVILKPVLEAPVSVYEASSDSFVDCAPGSVALEGPFAYFLSTLNVDRLESGFIITPLATRIRPEYNTMEVVVIRPLRSPQITEDSAQSRQEFAQTLMGSMGAARSATHLSVRYHGDKESRELPGQGGDGPALVEYYRCAGWEWIPDNGAKDAAYMCVDGAILEIEEGGRSQSECITHSGIKVFV